MSGERNRLRRAGNSAGTGARSTTSSRSRRCTTPTTRGINFVDTAELYGRGHREEVIGESLCQWRRDDKIYVATKVQPTVSPDPDDHPPAMRGRYPAWHLRAAVEASLRRLGVERIEPTPSVSGLRGQAHAESGRTSADDGHTIMPNLGVGARREIGRQSGGGDGIGHDLERCGVAGWLSANRRGAVDLETAEGGGGQVQLAGHHVQSTT